MRNAPVRILLIEDNPGDAMLANKALTSDAAPAAFQIEHATSLAAGLEVLARGETDVVLLDLTLPDSMGRDTFLSAQASAGEVPVVVLTGLGNESLGSELVREGAQDFLVKGRFDTDLLARSVQYAIERKQSEQIRKRLFQENQALAEIGRIITSSLDINEVYERLANHLRRVIPFDRLAISEIGSHQDNSIDSQAITPCDAAPQPGSITHEVANTRRGLLICPKNRSSFVARFPNAAPDYDAGFRSFLSVPLVLQDSVIGALHFKALQPEAFAQAHLALAERVGAQIAGVVANWRLYLALQREASEREVLAGIGRIISSTLDIDEVYERFVEEVRKLIPFYRITISDVDLEAGTFRNLYQSGKLDVPWAEEARRGLPLAGSLFEDVVYSRLSLISCAGSAEEFSEKFPRQAAAASVGLISAILTPLTSRDRVIGVLTARSMLPNAYTEHHLALAEQISAQIAGAIANARLYASQVQAEEALRKAHHELERRVVERTADLREAEEAARRLARENAVLAEISRIAGSSLDTNEILEELFEEARKLISFDRISIALVDFQTDTMRYIYSAGMEIAEWKTGDVFSIRGVASEQVIRNGRAQIFEAMPGEEPTSEIEVRTLKPAINAGLLARMVVPLKANDRVIGIISFRALASNAFDDDDLKIAERIGDQIAPVVQNALLYEEVQNAREEAEKASHAKSDFLANMSHEIRTPLNGVTGMIQLLLGTRMTSKQLNFLHMMKTSADSLLEIITDVLDISKIEAGKLELEEISFSLRYVINTTIDMLAMRAEEKGLNLTARIQPELPDTLMGDPVRLRQIIVNLVGNAIKFTDRGHIRLWAEISEDSLPRSEGAGEDDVVVCHIAVADTGAGIAPQYQEKIFAAFSQADNTTTRKHGGTGLGLAISARLVEMMGGRIWLESEPGQGSTFHFTARLSVSEQFVEAQALPGVSYDAEPPIGPLARKSQRQLRILLVEDNRINQALAVSMLEEWGHNVKVAGDGEEALAHLEHGRYDLILMDVQMPRMDGVETTHAIREGEQAFGGHIPIVAMTANAMSGDRERYIQAGMDDYIAKPIQARKLFETIERFCSASSSESETEMPSEQRVDEVMDMAAAIDSVGGKEALLKKIAEMFLEEYPGLLGSVKESIKSGDSESLMRAAHTLKGSVGIFAAGRAWDAALKLEQMGHNGNFDGADEACVSLEDEIERLKDALVVLLQSNTPAAP